MRLIANCVSLKSLVMFSKPPAAKWKSSFIRQLDTRGLLCSSSIHTMIVSGGLRNVETFVATIPAGSKEPKLPISAETFASLMTDCPNLRELGDVFDWEGFDHEALARDRGWSRKPGVIDHGYLKRLLRRDS